MNPSQILPAIEAVPDKTVDAHVMEMQVDNKQDPVSEPFDPVFARKVLRKIDLRILPIATCAYLCSHLDKSNVGNAKTLGMVGKHGLGLDPDGQHYALLNGFYFIAYAGLLIPGSLLGKLARTNLVIGCAVIWFGIAAACMAATNTYAQANAARFFVGMGEAGFGSVVPFYLARWYSKEELGLRVSIFVMSGPISGILNGLIAYGVSFSHSSLEPWRLLFVIEGCLAVLIGFLLLLILPGDIQSTKFLTEAERSCAIAMKTRQESIEAPRINWKQALGTFRSWKVALPAITYASAIMTGTALGTFLPTFTKALGFSGPMAQVFTLPPYICALVAIPLSGWLCDRYRVRGPGLAAGFVLEIIGFVLSLSTRTLGPRYLALILAVVGNNILVPINLTWIMVNAGNESRRAVSLPVMIMVAQALAIAAGYMFPDSDGPWYIKGTSITLALAVLGLAVTGLLSWLLYRENKKRDAIEGPVGDIQPNTLQDADMAKGFRYMW